MRRIGDFQGTHLLCSIRPPPAGPERTVDGAGSLWRKPDAHAPEWSRYVDLLRDDIWKNHPQIHIVDFDFYDVNAFNQCENNNCVLMAVENWRYVHPLLKILPVDWGYTIPFGLLHSPKPLADGKALPAGCGEGGQGAVRLTYNPKVNSA